MKVSVIVLLISVTLCVVNGELCQSDILRAYSTQPRTQLTGENGEKIANVLNQHLLDNYPKMEIRACEDFTLQKLNEITRGLFNYLNDELQAIYEANDDSRSLRYDNLEAFERSWEVELSHAEDDDDEDEDLHKLIRDGKCSEIVKYWIHHIPEAIREDIQHSIVMPLLPVNIDISAETVGDNQGHAEIYAQQTDCRLGHGGYNHEDCTEKVWSKCTSEDYSTCVSCASGLADELTDSCPNGATDYSRACLQPNPNDDDGEIATKNDAPLWPSEVSYEAKGFGIYPFWLFGNLESDITVGTDIKTHWSSVKNAELLEHASCGLSVAGYKDGVACNHLFVGSYSWLYTPDGSFCCKSGKKYSDSQESTTVNIDSRPPPPPPHGGGNIALTAPQTDWMRGMTYQGEAYHETPFYKGTIKNYTYDCSNICGPGGFYFWYYTTPEGVPVEQGEGCQVMPRTKTCRGANYIWHNYNQDTFQETEIDWDVFAVPSHCESTTNECYLP